MEAQYRCRNGRLFIKVEAGDQKALFERIAETEQVFDAVSECGLCHKTDLSFRVRVVKDSNKYYELFCRSCNATMTFGQHRTGNTLFPKNDWHRYQHQQEEDPSAAGF